MHKYRIIGNMTGNSMDAVDLVMTDFNGNQMTDVCAYSKPYDKAMQRKIEALRMKAFNKTKAEILCLPDFYEIHDAYIRQIADCINEMCRKYAIDKKTIDAIGFHGKTLDHNPPSKAKRDGTEPYTLQIGSGKMLADLTGIPVVYDFRSDLVMNGFEGAPLVGLHNAHIAATEGDGIYFNGGNTSNFAIVVKKKAVIQSDAGPFNEYTDNFVRLFTEKMFDENGMLGKKGKVNEALLQKIFDYGRNFYEATLPKSGDPAYYHKKEIFDYVADKGIALNDAVRTFEHQAAYMAALALTLVPEEILLPENIIFFGGGWKNPMVRESFAELLQGKGVILPEHKEKFVALARRFGRKPLLRQSALGEYMEARLFADMARYKLENKAWELPETKKAGQKIICGRIASPDSERNVYDDCVNLAAKGWQKLK